MTAQRAQVTTRKTTANGRAGRGAAYCSLACACGASNSCPRLIQRGSEAAAISGGGGGGRRGAVHRGMRRSRGRVGGRAGGRARGRAGEGLRVIRLWRCDDGASHMQAAVDAARYATCIASHRAAWGVNAPLARPSDLMASSQMASSQMASGQGRMRPSAWHWHPLYEYLPPMRRDGRWEPANYPLTRATMESKRRAGRAAPEGSDRQGTGVRGQFCAGRAQAPLERHRVCQCARDETQALQG